MLILLGQWLIVELGGDMFRTEPIAAADWLNIIVGTSPVMIIGEIYRAWCRRKQ
jgi:Ca2+-transporting ATPase